ncbi:MULTISPECIES: thiosulfate oxidation carrier complex protein SoxZ [Aquincola]|uniref:thiosulfate oxidation carrier complex protein SoxZ n=1 Tax=Aquincola TaxID=391952 RepID=UPI00061511AC|nr:MULTISPECIES: thiosulfate oxidation carrier complex protein SoxZ [Aquincola]MCR5867859.1 thiosulfate oxidation carrier complex protein SoxZ [Aquincola sp. J276]
MSGTAPSLIRARLLADGRVEVRVLMAHDMETGLRQDADGRLVPAWHIEQVEVALNGQPVLQAHWGTAVSRNPYLQLMLRGARAGDRIGVRWQDNRGGQRSDEALVG